MTDGDAKVTDQRSRDGLAAIVDAQQRRVLELEKDLSQSQTDCVVLEDALRAQGGKRSVAELKATQLEIVRAVDAIEQAPSTEVIEGVAWAGCLTVLVSESGTGKTFVMLNQAAAVSDGVPWQGRQTTQGTVVYIGFEGDAIGLRLQALLDQGHELEHLYVIRAHEPLSPRMTREGEQPSIGEVAVHAALDRLRRDLEAEGRPPIRLLQIDTARASMVGSEDSSEHVSAYLRAVRRIETIVPDAALELSHHAGWQDGESQRKRERGSSAWRGNCDATLYLEGGEYDQTQGTCPLTLRALKVRDTERPANLQLIRRRVDLGRVDRHGRRLTSCVIERDPRTPATLEAARMAAVEAETREADLKVLRVMRDHQVSSQRAVSSIVGLRHAVVVDAVGRILRAGWATHQQRQPYSVTSSGCAVLDGSSESFRSPKGGNGNDNLEPFPGTTGTIGNDRRTSAERL